MPGRSPSAKPLVLVSGCSSRLGTRLLRTLGQQHYRVLGLDAVTPPELPVTASFLRTDCGDWSDEVAVSRLQQRIHAHGDRIASVVHLETPRSMKRHDAGGAHETASEMNRLLWGLRSLPVEQFVFVNTLNVVGPGGESSANSDLVPHCRRPALIRVAGVYNERACFLSIGEHVRRLHAKDAASHFSPAQASDSEATMRVDDVVKAISTVVAKRRDFFTHEVYLIADAPLAAQQAMEGATSINSPRAAA